MKRIFSTKEKSEKPSRRESVSKPKPAPALQYFTYSDVVESNEPRVGDFPQHGDTVALGANEPEAEIARSRMSKRVSQDVQAGHEDIFANAPEEPLAPEGPSRRSRDGSRRSSRRMSRRGSTDGFGAGAGPSSSRGSRAISPERPLHVVNGDAPRATRESTRSSRRGSDVPAPQAPMRTSAPVAEPLVAPTPRQPAAPKPMAPQPVAPNVAPVVPIAQPALAALAASEGRRGATPPTAAASPIQGDTLSQIPTHSDRLSRVETRGTSGTIPQSARPQSGAASTAGGPSRQSTKATPIASRRMSLDTTKSKSIKSSRRQSKRSSKPVPLKYFTYDDVLAGEPPIFGEEPPLAEGESARNSRAIKGKQRESNVSNIVTQENGIDGNGEVDGQPPKTPTDPPRLAELPQRLSHMDMTGTGLSRKPTKESRDGAGARAAVAGPTGAQSQLQGAPAPAPVPVPPSHRPRGPLAASHGLDFSDIPGARPQQGAPPPVNMSTKPPSKRPSQEFRSGAAGSAATAAAAAGSGGAIGAAAGAAGHDATSKPARTSSFREHLNDDEVRSARSQRPAQKRPDQGATLAQEAQKETFLPATPVATTNRELKPSELPAQELDAAPAPQPVINRTQDALAGGAPSLPQSQSQTPRGAQTPRVARRVAPPPPQAQQPKAATTALGHMGADSQQDAAFVSAPSTPAAEKTLGGFEAPATTSQATPSTAEVIEKSKYNSADTTVTETVAPAVTHETVHEQIKHVREERITREIHTYDIYHRVQPIIDVEVLSTRHFLSTHDRGLVEVAESEIPGGPTNRPTWKIVAQPGNFTDRAALLDGRYASPPPDPAGVREETKQWNHPDGYPVTETTHIHPPTLYTGGAMTGQTAPFHFDHQSGAAGWLPPGVPQASVTRTRGNSITKSVDEAADDLNKVKLQDAVSVPMTAHSGAAQQSLRPATRDRVPSTEHLSSQNI